MKRYETPEFELVVFATEEVVTNDSGNFGDNDFDVGNAHWKDNDFNVKDSDWN